MRISDWSSDVCSSDLLFGPCQRPGHAILFRQRATGCIVLHALADDGGVQRPQPLLELGAALVESVLVGGIAEPDDTDKQIGREWCRESGCRNVGIAVGAVSIKTTYKKINETGI